MSQPESSSNRPRGVLVRRQTMTVYTVLLGLAAGALGIGCLLMVIELWQYAPLWSFPWNVPTNYR